MSQTTIFTNQDETTEYQTMFLAKLSQISFGAPALDQAPIKGHEILDFLKSEHFHEKCVSKNGSGNTKTLVTPHKESLLDHLLRAGEMCKQYADRNGLFQDRPWLPMNIGFWHDIGKPGCTTHLSKYLSMKFHGVIGGALIENLCTEEFQAEFELSSEDVALISLTADVHMCSYFPEQGGDKGDLHMDTMRLLPTEVRQALCCLRLGDQLGMEHRDLNEDAMADLKTTLLASQERYVENIMDSISPDHYAGTHCLTHGCLIQVNGISGAGKSTIAEKIQSSLGPLLHSSSPHILTRDTYIQSVTREKMLARGLINDKETVGYKECYAYYETQKSSLAPEVNRRMNRYMSELLSARHVVITDTMATMWPSRDTITSAVAEKAFRISLWIHSNQERPAFHHDLDVWQQKEINAKFKPTQWNPIASNLQWRDLTSCLEHKKGETDKQSTGVLKPHIAISLGRNGIKLGALQDLLHQISLMDDYWTSLGRSPLLKQTVGLDLENIVRQLYKVGRETMLEFFKTHYYKVKVSTIKEGRDELDLVTIKYEEGRNHLWQEPWMRQARGRTLAVLHSSESIDIVTVKGQHDRCPELLTSAHAHEGILETQDLQNPASDLLHLPQSIRDLSLDMNKSGKYNSPIVLSEKIDGCTGIISFLRKAETPRWVGERITSIVGRNVDTWKVDWTLPTGEYTVVISSSGVFGLGRDMKSYFLTSLIQHLGETARFHNDPLLVTGREEDLDMFWTNHGRRLFSIWLGEYVRTLSCLPCFEYLTGHTSWFCMTELVCRDRRTYAGNTFTCLATAYQTGGIYVLGEAAGSFYLPALSSRASSMIWTPQSKTVASGMDLASVLGDLNDKVMAGVQWVHNEGYVANVIELRETTRGSTLSVSYAAGKVKTPHFYKLHKWEKYGLPYLMATPSTMDYMYPIVGKMKRMMNGMDDAVQIAAVDLLKRFLFIATDEELMWEGNGLMHTLHDKARARLTEFLKGERDPTAVGKLIKMVANMMTDCMMEESIDVSRRLLASLGSTDVGALSRDDLCNLGKKILMTLEPWNSTERCDPRITSAYNSWKDKKMKTLDAEQKRTREEQLFDNIFQLVSQS